jgi:hypothetical protein
MSPWLGQDSIIIMERGKGKTFREEAAPEEDWGTLK